MKASVKSSILVAAFAALTLSTTPLQAWEDQTRDRPADPLRAQRSVVYGDLNLASSAGRKVLHRRIEAAARQVCGTTRFRNAGGLRAAAENRRCFARATAEALSAVEIKTQALASAR